MPGPPEDAQPHVHYARQREREAVRPSAEPKGVKQVTDEVQPSLGRASTAKGRAIESEE